MTDPQPTNDRLWIPVRRGWVARFAAAFRGIGQGMVGQPSFAVHLAATTAVLILATVLPIAIEQWCLLVLCIGVVLAAELFNSSLELICKSITQTQDTKIGRALNIASGGVLTVALAAAIVGGVILVPELVEALQ